jgi:hypothetical protein
MWLVASLSVGHGLGSHQADNSYRRVHGTALGLPLVLSQ